MLGGAQGPSRLSFCLLLGERFFVDEDHQVVEDARIDVKEVNLHFTLLLSLKQRQDAGGHGSDLLVDADEVRVRQVAPLAVLQGHLRDTAQHRSNEQIIGLVDLPQVDERQERDVFKNSVLLAEVALFEQTKHLLDQVVYHGQYLEELSDLESLRMLQEITQPDAEQLADADEVHQCLDVLDVKIADKDLHANVVTHLIFGVPDAREQ